jgi:nitrite reductase (NADH) small subunit
MRRAVCKLSDLPVGGGYLVEVDGEPIALFRVGDSVHAIENTCPHREGPLAFGELRGSTVYCPLHSWGFDVRTGACDEPLGASVRTYAVTVDGDDVLLEL